MSISDDTYNPFVAEALGRKEILHDEVAESGVFTTRLLAFLKSSAISVFDDQLSLIYTEPGQRLETFDVPQYECFALSGINRRDFMRGFFEDRLHDGDRHMVVAVTLGGDAFAASY